MSEAVSDWIAKNVPNRVWVAGVARDLGAGFDYFFSLDGFNYESGTALPGMQNVDLDWIDEHCPDSLLFNLSYEVDGEEILRQVGNV